MTFSLFDPPPPPRRATEPVIQEQPAAVEPALQISDFGQNVRRVISAKAGTFRRFIDGKALEHYILELYDGRCFYFYIEDKSRIPAPHINAAFIDSSLHEGYWKVVVE
jgi:hypothetical protein